MSVDVGMGQARLLGCSGQQRKKSILNCVSLILAWPVPFCLCWGAGQVHSLPWQLAQKVVVSSCPAVWLWKIRVVWGNLGCIWASSSECFSSSPSSWAAGPGFQPSQPIWFRENWVCVTFTAQISTASTRLPLQGFLSDKVCLLQGSVLEIK